MRNIFEKLCTEEGEEEGKAVFEGVFKFAVSEARNNFVGTDSSVQRDED